MVSGNFLQLTIELNTVCLSSYIQVAKHRTVGCSV